MALDGDATSSVLVASLIALAVGLVKVVERLIDWAMKRKKQEQHKQVEHNNMVLKLDDTISKMFVEDHAHINTMLDVMSVRDGQGVPLVYTPRSIMDEQRQMSMLLGQISASQSRLAETQDRMMDSQSKLCEIVDELLREVKTERDRYKSVINSVKCVRDKE